MHKNSGLVLVAILRRNILAAHGFFEDGIDLIFGSGGVNHVVKPMVGRQTAVFTEEFKTLGECRLDVVCRLNRHICRL